MQGMVQAAMTAPAAPAAGGQAGNARPDGAAVEAYVDPLADVEDWLDRAGLRLERRSREDNLLQRAAIIQEENGRWAQKSKRAAPAGSRMPCKKFRKKCHRDFLLGEMVWLAKEFQKERRWKMSQSKKFALVVKKSKLDVGSRAELRRQQEEKSLRKVARGISQEVMAWWSKVERLVVYKRRAGVEAVRKQELDHQLDFLVSQTERYVDILAKTIESGPGAAKAAPEPRAASIPPLPVARATPVWPNECPGEAPEGAATVAGGGDAAMKAPDVLANFFAEVPGDSDFEPSQESLDDEGTLAAEEAQAATEGCAGQREELASLHREMELPIEKLMERYRDAPPAEGRWGVGLPGPAPPSVGDAMDLLFAEDSDDTDFELSGSGSYGDDDEATLAAEEARVEREGGANVAEELAILRREQEGALPGGAAARGAAATMRGGGGAGPSGEKAGGPQDKDVFLDEPGDTDFQPSEDMEAAADDEGTLAAEEEAEAAEGIRQDPAQELAGLKAAMEEPLEVLRARYLQISPSPSPSPSSSSSPSLSPSSTPGGVAGGSGEPHVPAPLTQKGKMEPAVPAPLPEVKREANEIEQHMEDIFADDSEDSDFEPSVRSSDAEDDEATLAAEEAKEEREGLQKGQAQELAGLQEEIEVPLGEVHRRFSAGELKAEQPQKLEPAGGDPAAGASQEPYLLKHSLRQYQVKGMEWMTTLAQKGLNGILADEMGLGKTIQTIALLARWAAEKGQWGPHLIVVPTSVMLNWEMEFKKWCPAFKILTYYGSARERQAKRQGWSKPNSFHVCITSYTLILADAKMFRRKQWNFLILDEAHLIKNWQSLKWQTLLNFHSQHRVLLTGTPLQNSLMELWSLMHFLMPTIFESHDEFKEWFSNPMTGMVEGQEGVDRRVIRRLHGILRPFILRRLKSQVEKQMPKKYEHIVTCRLSRRQRQLYDDYISSSDTQAALAGGNYFSVFGVLMALRKVCNHPDLFEGRAITSPFTSETLCFDVPSPVVDVLFDRDSSHVDLCVMNFDVVAQEGLTATGWARPRGGKIASAEAMKEAATRGSTMAHAASTEARALHRVLRRTPSESLGLFSHMRRSLDRHRTWALDRAHAKAYVNDLRCERRPVYGADLRRLLWLEDPVRDAHAMAADPRRARSSSVLLRGALQTYAQRLEGLLDIIRHCLVALPRARAAAPRLWCLRPDAGLESRRRGASQRLHPILTGPATLSWPELVCHKMYFPNRWLVQYDCGKLQELAVLMRRLKQGGHRVLIFTQMSKMLDVLEVFLNLHSYTYMRLDGTTKPDQRQILMTKFNSDDKTFCFILSTRSGGVGINLTGADTVIFYDSDWNPAMDAQAQDRCHRIGQTRDVHVYRLVTENTIESNILLKSNQKRHLDHLAIQSGKFGNLEATGNVQQAEVAGIENALTALGGTPLKERLTSTDVKSAIRSAEDADDRRAAAAAELEAQEEAAEFGDGGGDGDGGGAVGASTEGNVEAAAGEGKAATLPGSEGAAAGSAGFEQREQKARVPTVEELQYLLFPVERYAVAFYEGLYPATPEERGVRSVPLPEREPWTLQDVEERRGMLDAGYNPEELLFCDPFERETARRVYLSSVRAAQGPRPRLAFLASS